MTEIIYRGELALTKSVLTHVPTIALTEPRLIIQVNDGRNYPLSRIATVVQQLWIPPYGWVIGSYHTLYPDFNLLEVSYVGQYNLFLLGTSNDQIIDLSIYHYPQTTTNV